MNVLKPQRPAAPKPKTALPTPPKSGKPPKPSSPFSNPPLKPPLPANPIKPVLQVGGLPGAMLNIFGKQPPGVLVRTAAKALPPMPPLAQQVADYQDKQMANVRQVEAALKADKRAQVSARRGLG